MEKETERRIIRGKREREEQKRTDKRE